MLWKHQRYMGEEKEEKNGTENPSRLNNVGNLLMEREQRTYHTKHILRWCIALLLFGTHIASGITIHHFSAAFALDFSTFLRSRAKKNKKHTE